jgi:hypothetical protein
MIQLQTIDKETIFEYNTQEEALKHIKQCPNWVLYIDGNKEFIVDTSLEHNAIVLNVICGSLKESDVLRYKKIGNVFKQVTRHK